jgi:hypothetical protein
MCRGAAPRRGRTPRSPSDIVTSMTDARAGVHHSEAISSQRHLRQSSKEAKYTLAIGSERMLSQA